MVQLKCEHYVATLCSSHSYSTKEDKLIRTLNIDECVIRNITFSQDGKNLFCGCEDGLVLLISLEGI